LSDHTALYNIDLYFFGLGTALYFASVFPFLFCWYCLINVVGVLNQRNHPWVAKDHRLSFLLLYFCFISLLTSSHKLKALNFLCLLPSFMVFSFIQLLCLVVSLYGNIDFGFRTEI
jgi:hypothetical protein